MIFKKECFGTFKATNSIGEGPFSTQNSFCTLEDMIITMENPNLLVSMGMWDDIRHETLSSESNYETAEEDHSEKVIKKASKLRKSK